MNRSHIIAGAAIAVVAALYYAIGASRLLGSSDALMGAKTLLFVVSAVGVVWFVEWLNHRDEQP
jgi:hypothetical protein